MMSLSYLDQLLRFPEREGLITQCPALALFLFQEFVAALHNETHLVDPLAVEDEVAVFLSASSVGEVIEKVFVEPQEGNISLGPFWRTFRDALECAWNPAPEGTQQRCLSQVAERVRFCDKAKWKMPLAEISLQNALHASRSLLRAVTTCVLAGSIDSLGERRGQPIAAMLQFSRLIPMSSEPNMITSAGLGFCMRSLQEQWWTLLSVALDRVLALVGDKGVTRTELWQLLAVLFALDSSQFIYFFPTKEEDLAAFHLLARLSEIGLVYPLLCEGLRCFVLSPHFHHALCWISAAQMCTAALLDDENSVSHRIRREDEDTIITETNFRLYAYTKNRDLLSILDQFAENEGEVDEMISCYRVTRASFAAALKKGLNASDILRFLAVKAHPCMLTNHNGREHKGLNGLSSKGVSKRFKNASDVQVSAIVPQSFCDQLLIWEKECRRLIFHHNLVLLRNVSVTQQDLLLRYLNQKGEGNAVVHQDKGCVIVQRDVFERLLAPLLT